MRKRTKKFIYRYKTSRNHLMHRRYAYSRKNKYPLEREYLLFDEACFIE